MSQHVTPGDLAGTISATKGRVSRLERELVAVKRNRTRTVSDWDNRIAIHGSSPAENVAMAWLPHDAQIVSLSILSQVIGTPGRLSAGLLLRPSAEIAEEYFVTRPGDELRLLGGSSFVDVTWTTPDNSLTPVRVDVVPRVVPQLVPVFVVLSQPGAVTGDYTFLQAVFEFDIGPRQPSA